MLLEEIKNIKSEKRDLRNFGLVIGIALGILGGLLWWKGKSTYPPFFIFSAVFICLGMILPSLLKPLQKVWMIFAVILGWIMTRVILSVLFYVVFTGIGLGSRLFGKQFLDLKMRYSKDSYWIHRERKPFDKKAYERQF
jgi:small basic protein